LKLKYYLRGLGIGIIVTTLIFAISIQSRGGIMTDDRVVERAKELGMVIPTTDDDGTDATEITEQGTEPEKDSTVPQPDSDAEPVNPQ
jgi:hypothetical protein